LQHLKKSKLPLSESNNDFFESLFEPEPESNPQSQHNATQKFQFLEKIGKEVFEFSDIIKYVKTIATINSSRQFWLENEERFPILNRLYTVVSAIHSSSAIIERFCCICGIICSKRNLPMKEELFLIRSMLVSNMDLLEN